MRSVFQSPVIRASIANPTNQVMVITDGSGYVDIHVAVAPMMTGRNVFIIGDHCVSKATASTELE